MFEYAVAVYACLFDHVKGLRYGVAYMIWHVCIACCGDKLATHICIHLHYLALGIKSISGVAKPEVFTSSAMSFRMMLLSISSI